MSLAPYTLADLAHDLNRGHDWASRHWRDLVAKGKLPRPIEDTGPRPQTRPGTPRLARFRRLP